MKPCPECDHYETCTELCSEAEAYVNQDNVKRREARLEEPHNPEAAPPAREIQDERDREESAKLRILIIQMHLDGMSSYKIAYHLPCTSRYVRQVVGSEHINKRAENIRNKEREVI